MPIQPVAPIPPLSSSDINRFWSFIDRREEKECWPWMGSKKDKGHGIFSVTDYRVTPAFHKKVSAHRVAWLLATGSDPSPLFSLHKCDNPPCCNPAHLFVGSNDDNIRDAVSKGRMASGDRHGSRTCPEVQRQAGVKRALLNEDDVRLIKRLRKDGMYQKDIAKVIGKVKPATISAICTGANWSWVNA
jgi:hypothetical protein|tara:strand:- start:2264 stop:2827 length:564 start_codon:yes stop_codon:yes gene_type:complete